MKAAIIKTLLALAFLWAVDANAGDQNAKEKKRIAQIEHDFDATYAAVLHTTTYYGTQDFWSFIKFDPQLSFKAYAFSTPIMPTDRQVVYAIVSAWGSARAVDALLEQEKKTKGETNL